MTAKKAVRLIALEAMLTRMRHEDPELFSRVVAFAKNPPSDVYEQFAKAAATRQEER